MAVTSLQPLWKLEDINKAFSILTVKIFQPRILYLANQLNMRVEYKYFQMRKISEIFLSFSLSQEVIGAYALQN